MPRILIALILLAGITIAGAGEVYRAYAVVETFTVTKIADTNDGVCNADCSLREAITEANDNNNNLFDRDVINFAIPAHTSTTFAPTSPLPIITEPVEINGLSQAGTSCSPTRLLAIVLDGGSAGAGADGLVVNYTIGQGTIIKGLVLTSWDNAIELQNDAQHKVECNNIGINAAGTTADANTRGVVITNASTVTIGGTTSAQRNIISGNGAGILIGDGTGSSLSITGNYIGTNAAGTGAVANATGIVVNDFSGVVIGGNTTGARNIISGNTSFGINAQGTVSGQLEIYGNYIGYQANGTTTLQNGSSPVRVTDNLSGATQVGGVSAGQGNRIFSQTGVPAVLVNQAGVGVDDVYIRGNRITSNALGINLQPTGEANNTTTGNDALDPDTGPNGLTNFPVLVSAVAGSPGVINGTLQGKSNTTYTIDFYKGTSCGSPGSNDGENYLGLVPVNTAAGTGIGAFSASISGFAEGDSITATATHGGGGDGTSEFSACITATGQVPQTFTVNTTNDVSDGTCNLSHCSLREAITAANGNANPEVQDVIAFDLGSTGTVYTIELTSSLPDITAPVRVDGITQPGSVCTDAGRGLWVEVASADGEGDGISIFGVASPGVVIRGLAIGDLSGNGIAVTNSVDTHIECNYIGMNAFGDEARPVATGIRVNDSVGTIIGGGGVAKRNVIGNSSLAGIDLTGDGVTVSGNYIGLDDGGGIAFPNAIGIELNRATNTTIGGTDSDEENVIAFNLGPGIQVQGDALEGVAILGNSIGYGPGGNVEKANRQGILIQTVNDGSLNGGIGFGVQVGGTALGEANRVFSGSSFSAVEVVENGSTVQDVHVIRGNSIKSNQLGINLKPTGEAANTVTGNDALDNDGGPNGQQNFPVLTAALGGVPGNVTGTLSTKANTEYTVDFYRGGGTCGSAGTRDGEVYLGSAQVITNGSGVGTINVDLDAGFPGGASITATATDPDGRTSEFSACVGATAPPATTFVVNSANDADDGTCDVTHCSLREAIDASNANNNPTVQDEIQFNIPGGGVKVITLGLNSLSAVLDSVFINGLSQPGAICTDNARTILIQIEGDDQVHSNGLFLAPGVGPGVRVVGLSITGFADAGIQVQGGTANSIDCNNIGIAADGQTAGGNGGPGVVLSGTVAASVGNDAVSARNIIGSNGGPGVKLIEGASSSFIAFNYIGVAGDGTSARPNGSGVEALFGLDSSLFMNVVSGNTGAGVFITGKSSNFDVRGNIIGYAANGTTLRPNGGVGIDLRQATGVLTGFHDIGGTNPQHQNRIYAQDQNAIEISEQAGSARNTPIRGNSITVVGTGLGIALTPSGEGPFDVTDNDVLDADDGPNFLQNFPVISFVTDSPDEVIGSLHSAPNTDFHLDFFAGSACDATRDGERFLGTVTVSTDGAGNASFAVSTLGAFVLGEGITATATDPDGNTSEFSDCSLAQPPVTPIVVSIITPDEATAGTLQEIVVTVTGSGFTNGDLVTWDGQPVDTTFVSATELTFVATPDLIGNAMTGAVVSVLGSSDSVLFNVRRSSSDVDCSGEADASDALRIMQVLAGLASADADCPADADKSGGVNLADVLHIRRVISGLVEPFRSLHQ